MAKHIPLRKCITCEKSLESITSSDGKICFKCCLAFSEFSYDIMTLKRAILYLKCRDKYKETDKGIVHGVDCEQEKHEDDSTHLHHADDDTPFNVDFVDYCGRCHIVLDKTGEIK